MNIISDKKHVKKVPPDGGWGWIIVIASSTCNIITLPVITSFGLIFKDRLIQLNMPATTTSYIINISSVSNMLIGLFTGPLLKTFGYRKIAYFSGLLFSLGITLTSFATTFTHFLITYCLMAGIGNGLGWSAFYLALNTYFSKKRTKAAGFAMTINGLGPIIYPPLITLLLSYYGVQGCVLILGGISANVLVAASLLQPVKYHEINDISSNNNGMPYVEGTVNNEEKCQEQIIVKENINNQKPLQLSNSIDVYESVNTIWNYSSDDENVEDYLDIEIHDKNEEKQLMELELGSSGFGNGSEEIITKNIVKNSLINVNETEKETLTNGNNNYNILSTQNKLNKKPKRFYFHIIEFFDFDLLKDLTFVNIIVGMAISTVAEINFSVLLPFILSDLNFTNLEIASAMSILGIMDIVSRFLSSFIGDCVTYSSRIMYLISLALLLASRLSILLVTNYHDLIAVSLAMGLAKGIRTVYMILVIPAHVPIDKLASANGIRMVSNGISLIILGPTVGYLRDHFGNYIICIIYMNLLTFLCILMWSIEIIYKTRRNKKY